jgi:hypothetical protein
MTNPMPPSTPPAPAPSAQPPSGFPKWIIIVIVVLLVIIVGCCGGVYTCTHFMKKGVEAMGDTAREALARAQAEEERQAAAARAAGEQPGGVAETPAAGETSTAGNPAGGNADNTPNQRSVAGSLGVGRLPVNFPKDIPVMNGLTPGGFSTADKIKGSGVATFTGTLTRDQVVSYYESEMPKQGWTLNTNQDLGEASIMSFSKDKLTATIQITPDSDKKSAVVSVHYETQQ